MAEEENLVRKIHNAVATSTDPAEASCRVQGTTPLELRLLVRDVLRKLELRSAHRVLDVGCGTGVLGVPLARRAASYVGVDFADQAVQVLRQRLAESGLDHHAEARVMDFVAADDGELEELGTFDRTLVYAMLHYVRSEAEGQRLVHRALALTRPGGRILFGSLPLEELGAGVWPPSTEPRHRGRTVRWALAPHAGAAGIPVSRRWRTGHVLYARAKRGFPGLHAGANAAPPQSLPPGYVTTLSRALVEHWIESAPVRARIRWTLPQIGVPQYYSRVDLIAVRVELATQP